MLLFWSYNFSINDLSDDVICNIAVYADDNSLYSKCDQATVLWQQLDLVEFEHQSDLEDWIDAGNGLLISMLEKLSFFPLTVLTTLVLLI